MNVTRIAVACSACCVVVAPTVLVGPGSAAASAAPGDATSRTSSPHGKGFGTAKISVPKAGINNAAITSYKGRADDGRGTAIQNRGMVAAPWGTWGGVEPGAVGNLLLTGHRTAHGAVMARVPRLRNGDLIHVTWQGKTYTYRIEYSLRVSFRNNASRSSQDWQVPGRKGIVATRPAIVLSTCATPEDRALGLDWHDRFGNRTHRIDKVGFLIA